jgi:chloramphenicol O-acetyltransferase type A
MFKDFSDPFFNISTKVDVTNLMKYCREKGESFFVHSLIIGSKAANSIEEFRYRLAGDEVRLYDKLHFGSTVLHQNKTFSFCYFEYYDDLDECYRNSKKALDDEKANPGFDPKHGQLDILHYSVLPWIEFTSLKHPKNLKIQDSIPKIVYGKYHESENTFKMPINVELHHSLADGYHISLFLEKWQEIEKTYKI